jgi:DNA-binding transcriptional ArsR family regulator
MDRRNLKPEKINRIAQVLKIISHPVRLHILELLEFQKKMCVTDIIIETNSEQSTLSHHLLKMKQAGILDSERQGKQILYYIKLPNVTKIFDCMENCEIIE